MNDLSPLQRHRLKYKPHLPLILQHPEKVVTSPDQQNRSPSISSEITHYFPLTARQPILNFSSSQITPTRVPLKVGVVLSGGQAPGGHNVITGLYDALKKIHSESVLYGFLEGASGVISQKYILITSDLVDKYRNQGGFDMIGSGRAKIESDQDLTSAQKCVKQLDLNGLVIIGGDDSNTNAAILSEYFKKQGVKTCVLGVPKTIDGDLRNEFIELSFGFDTATKVYSEIIGNLLTDVRSSKKYYFFIKMMGRSASHITLECALNTHPNLALISEEILKNGDSLPSIIEKIVQMIVKRADEGKNYGAILIPEGLIEFIPEFKLMIKEMNQFHGKEIDIKAFMNRLSVQSAACLSSLPDSIQKQLLLDRDPHGNVPVSKIETERLLISLVEKRLQDLKIQGQYTGQFHPVPLFCGYEGRSALPTNFDADYCYGLGHVAAILLANQQSGYICCIRNLADSSGNWEPLGIPLVSLMHLEERSGKIRPVIRKALVDLESPSFHRFLKHREAWKYGDNYCSPGPIQFDLIQGCFESRPTIIQ